ncbi:phage gp6-like head-tail connector protein [Streptomyces sp. NPDC060184]|uniref:phage gp6-like head-tail connector protein n=1 Tax=Streptomyces sp. NPDC060184 TaxID=3347064 RepID=UPI0036644F6A
MAAADYGELATLREMLGIQESDTSRDGLLSLALTTASRSIDKSTGRRFWLDPVPVTRTYRLAGRIVREQDGDALLVDDIGGADIVVATGTTGSWSTVTTYDALPDNAIADGRPITSLLLTGGWGLESGRVQVTTRFGWPEVPADIDMAAHLLAARLYKRKDSPEGVTGSAEWGVVRLSRRDPDVWNLIEQYVLPGIG